MRSLQLLLARWHMSDCNPTKIPCSGKLNEILTQLQGPCYSRSGPAARLQGAHRQPTLSPNRHDPRDQLDRIRPRTIHDQSRRATHGRCEKGTAIPSISQESTSSMVRYRQRPARHYPRLPRRFLRQHPEHPLVLHRLRLPRQRRSHLLALYQDTPEGTTQKQKS